VTTDGGSRREGGRSRRKAITYGALSDRERVVELLQRIRALTADLKGSESTRVSRRELRAKERARERLRWELALVARRAANGGA
jgi:hypothetical protein